MNAPSEFTPDTEVVREQYTREQPPHIGTVTEKGREFDRWLAAHDAEVEARALEAAADAVDLEAAERAAQYRVADVRCLHCDLRIEEKDQYTCNEGARFGHIYGEEELAEAARVVVEPTSDGQWLRERAATIRKEADR